MGMIDPMEITVASTSIYITRARINSSWVTVRRTSEKGKTPLTSMLEINPINEVLNGTLNVTCSTIEFASIESNTIYIINNIIKSPFILKSCNLYMYSGLPRYPNSSLITVEKEFHIDGVTVNLHWSQESHENLFVSYN